MTEQRLTLETAKLAIQKGFSITHQDGFLNLPIQSLLQKWLREKYNCFVEVSMHSIVDENGEPKLEKFSKKEDLRFSIEVNFYGENFEIEQSEDCDFYEYDFKSYEDALEAGLQEALKLIPEKK